MTTAGSLPSPYAPPGGTNLADILERVLDTGIVIAGDIRINLLDIELLTIKLRLVVASVDKAKEMGIDWWEHDPELSSRARDRELSAENAELRARLEELERRDRPAALAADGATARSAGGDPAAHREGVPEEAHREGAPEE
ncbi:gas vesicle protein [Streptomyces odontomachi]|uniref:gas vesicle protein n=1 Tax=Streptomyces odontomachi TaxID=2944940 RepID=UPI00210A7248|nr:gas vesicle protein [Streptomyces sp. ODS25]